MKTKVSNSGNNSISILVIIVITVLLTAWLLLTEKNLAMEIVNFTYER